MLLLLESSLCAILVVAVHSVLKASVNSSHVLPFLPLCRIKYSQCSALIGSELSSVVLCSF